MFALRSYFYLLAHTIGISFPMLLDALFLMPMTKPAIFYGVRFTIGITAAICFTFLLRAVRRKFGVDTAQLLQLFLVVTPGTFISITAFLPSTFAMICYT